MAYRRSIAARANLFYQRQQRISPSISNIHRRDTESEEFQTKSISRYAEVQNYIQQRFLVTGSNLRNYRRPKCVLQDRRFAVPAGCGIAYGRNYSSAPVGEGAAEKRDAGVEVAVDEGAAEKVEVLDNVVGAVRDTAVEVAPDANEVFAVAADMFAPVAALQYVIDYVHCLTGLNWWTSIVVTTLIIRCLQLPLSIYHVKSSAKLALLQPHWAAVTQETIIKKGLTTIALKESVHKKKALLREYGISPFNQLIVSIVRVPITCCFFFAVAIMAGQVPSFKDGGILWFTDLSTPDSLYVFPVLFALTYWIMVECNAQEAMVGKPPPSGMIKNLWRVYAALTIPVTAMFPKALFCYWLTSVMFSVAFGLVIQKPAVKNYLGIPIVPVTAPLPSQIPIVEAVPQVQKSASWEAIDESPPPNLRYRREEKKVKGRKTGRKS